MEIDAPHANASRWQLRYPEGTEFAEKFMLTAAESHIPTYRYTSEEVLALEIDRIWNRTWQVACREEEVAQPGDFMEYRLADQSFLVVRGDDGRIRGFFDTCRHRGTLLRAGYGTATELRCRYHWWCWDLQGRLKEIPDRRLFIDLDDAEYALQQVACDTWGGFVFIHPDRDRAGELLDFLGPVASQLDSYHLEGMRASINSTIHLSCNWKVAVEAFLEVYHVQGIHPQLMPIMDDVNTTYELLGDHSRMIVPYGVPSMRLEHVDASETYEAFLVASMETGFRPRKASAPRPEAIPLPPELFSTDAHVDALDVRRYLIQRIRQRGTARGYDYSELSDEQMIDDWHYFVFPGAIFNLHAGGFLFFRVRPDANSPDSCWFDVFTFKWPDEGTDSAPVRNTVVDEGAMNFGQVLNQDFSNLPYVQRGLHSRALKHTTISAQEVRIAHFHRIIGRLLEEA